MVIPKDFDAAIAAAASGHAARAADWGMFAIKAEDDQPAFVLRGQKGYAACASPLSLDAWASIYAMQTDRQRAIATAASMFGWNVVDRIWGGAWKK